MPQNVGSITRPDQPNYTKKTHWILQSWSYYGQALFDCISHNYKNFLTEMTPVWNFTESELNKCLCHSPLYKSELLLNLFLLFLRHLLACFVVVDGAEKKILVTFAIFANFAGFQMTFFAFTFKKSQLFLNLLFFLFLRCLLAFNVVFVIAIKN